MKKIVPELPNYLRLAMMLYVSLFGFCCQVILMKMVGPCELAERGVKTSRIAFEDFKPGPAIIACHNTVKNYICKKLYLFRESEKNNVFVFK